MSAETNAPIDPDLLRRAQKRVALRMGFLSHLMVYALVNSVLIVFNLFQGGPLWSFWPIFGWGIGLAAHGLSTWFALNGDGMRERMLKQEIERLGGGR